MYIFTVYSLFNSLKSLSCFKSKAEFAVYLSCFYKIVSMSVDTWLDPEHYARLLIHFACNSFKSVKLTDIVNDYVSDLVFQGVS